MRSFIAIAVLCAALSVNTAFAEEASRQDAVRIEMDQAAKAFIFIIDDEPVAMLDKVGLHVVEAIEYGHSLTDTGPERIKKTIASRGTEAADD